MKILLNLVEKTRPYLSNVWARGVSVVASVTVLDFVWTRYVGNIADKEPLSAATWAVAVIVLGAYTTISYVGDNRMVLPAAIGAFLGTYYGV